ncbi:hypothetical protein ACNY9Y_001400 [Cronobacter dublinensis]
MEAKKMNLFEWFVRTKFKTQVWTLIIISLLTIIVMMAIYYKLTNHQGKAFHTFYQTSLRGYLFTGFISVGSLLLSLHTFVIVNLRDKLFLTDHYRNKFAEKAGITGSVNIQNINERELLKPLDNLSSFVNISVWLAILTAVSQFTLGMADYGIASVFCIWLAMLTICFLLNSLILIREHIKNMLHQSN